jgi:tetratricopeptide (TPR) repeat protein
VEKNAVDERKLRPFQFGEEVLVPNLPARYAQSGTLMVYHQILFPARFSGSAVTLHYLIYRGNDEVESDVVQELNYSTIEFAGKAVGIRKDIPLADVTLGSKKLVIEMRQNDQALVKSAPLAFAVETEVNPGLWKYAVSIPGFDSAYHSYTLAQQFLRAGNSAQALSLMEESLQKFPNSLEIRVQMMRMAMSAKLYDKALALGQPVEVQNPRDKDLLWLMGWANYELEKFADTVRFFERLRLEDPKKVEVLNLLADCYFRLGETAKSLERVEQSLALNPNQQDVLDLKRKIQAN